MIQSMPQTKQTDYRARLAENVAMLMESRGLTYRALAKAVSLPPSRVYHLTRTKHEPSFGTVTAVADYFCVDIDWLCNRTVGAAR